VRLKDTQRRELEVRQGMQQLEEDKRNFELIMQRTLDEERTKGEAAEARAGEKFQSRIMDLELKNVDMAGRRYRSHHPHLPASVRARAVSGCLERLDRRTGFGVQPHGKSAAANSRSFL
jgi:hypothetical protein